MTFQVLSGWGVISFTPCRALSNEKNKMLRLLQTVRFFFVVCFVFCFEGFLRAFYATWPHHVLICVMRIWQPPYMISTIK